jgi:biopolymer transport protein ExbD
LRRHSPFAERRRGLTVAMTPMIDVVFLLLVFFVWSARFTRVEYSLPSRLVAAVGTGSESIDTPLEVEDFDRVVVRILWDEDHPVWLVNDEARSDLAEVAALLEALANIKRDAPVVLDPDAEVPLGHVIDIYDVALAAKFEKVQFATAR